MAWGWRGELPGLHAPLLYCQGGDREAQAEVKTPAAQEQVAQDSTSPSTSPPASPSPTSPTLARSRGPSALTHFLPRDWGVGSTPHRQVEGLTYKK